MAVTGLSLMQASAHLQITVRKLSYWIRMGILHAQRKGKNYYLGPRAMLKARILDCMKEYVSHQAIRPHLKNLDNIIDEIMILDMRETWIVVMLSPVAVKRIEKIHGTTRLAELAAEGPLFALSIPSRWKKAVGLKKQMVDSERKGDL